MTENTQQKGFTIVELLVVIVVIAILAAITITTFNGLQRRAMVSALTSDAKNGQKVINMYNAQYGTYPDSLDTANDGGPLRFRTDVTTSYVKTSSGYCLSLSTKSSGGVSIATNEQGVVSEAACNQPGWTASYYANNALSVSPAVTAQEMTAINYSWGTSGPSGVPVDNFSVRWSGGLSAPSSGTYTFYVTSDDGQRLYINGSLVINNWTPQASTTKTATVDLQAGDQISIIYEYQELTGNAVARLEWMPPGGTRTVFVPGA